MNLKMIGAICIIAACGGWGVLIASQHLQRIHLLRQLIGTLDYMECELQYRCTALPQLCRQAANQYPGKVGTLFLNLAEELEAQISPNVELCMAAVLEKYTDLPAIMRKLCRSLGSSLGRFDMPGQLRGLENVRAECRRKLEDLQHNKDARLRSYQTLGLCAGAALAILFV